MAQILQEPPITIVELDDSYDALDVARSREIQELLLGPALAGEQPILLLDFGRTSYFGSNFIELLFRTWKRARERNGRLAVCGLSPFCRDVLRTARLDTMWDFYADRATALAALRGAAA
ncbi:MAG: STAS domain-containing protein [Pirellulales bacterium]|nr:STAS domain-containing protein [Pirellulales bacterium]